MALTSIALPSVREQLALLEARKLQYQRAALQAKRGQDLEQAKARLRLAKRLEAQITQVRAGRPVDLAKVSPSCLSRAFQAAPGRCVHAVSHTFIERWDLDRMW